MGSAGGDPQGVQRKAHLTDDPTRDRVQAILKTGDRTSVYEIPWLARRLLEALDENERLHDETVDILLPLVTYLMDRHSERYGGRHCVDVALELLREYEGER